MTNENNEKNIYREIEKVLIDFRSDRILLWTAIERISEILSSKKEPCDIEVEDWEKEFDELYIGSSRIRIKAFIKQKLQSQKEHYENIIMEMIGNKLEYNCHLNEIEQEYKNGKNQKRNEIIEIAKKHNININ